MIRPGEIPQGGVRQVAELLETSVASVNSALQRARATLDAHDDAVGAPPAQLDADDRALLDRYVAAFEDYDMDGLVALLHEDATLSMPPYELWLRGTADIRTWFLTTGIGCRGSRLVPTMANGLPAFGQYRASGPNGEHEPWALQVIETDGERVIAINSFLDTARFFPMFGLPMTLDEVPAG